MKALGLPGLRLHQGAQALLPAARAGARTWWAWWALDGHGLEGLELAFEDELSGQNSRLSGFRDAKGRKLLVTGAPDAARAPGRRRHAHHRPPPPVRRRAGADPRGGGGQGAWRAWPWCWTRRRASSSPSPTTRASTPTRPRRQAARQHAQPRRARRLRARLDHQGLRRRRRAGAEGHQAGRHLLLRERRLEHRPPHHPRHPPATAGSPRSACSRSPPTSAPRRLPSSSGASGW